MGTDPAGPCPSAGALGVTVDTAPEELSSGISPFQIPPNPVCPGQSIPRPQWLPEKWDWCHRNTRMGRNQTELGEVPISASIARCCSSTAISEAELSWNPIPYFVTLNRSGNMDSFPCGGMPFDQEGRSSVQVCLSISIFSALMVHTVECHCCEQN